MHILNSLFLKLHLKVFIVTIFFLLMNKITMILSVIQVNQELLNIIIKNIPNNLRIYKHTRIF